MPLHLAEQPDRRFDHRAHPGIQFGYGHNARVLPGDDLVVVMVIGMGALPQIVRDEHASLLVAVVVGGDVEIGRGRLVHMREAVRCSDHHGHQIVAAITSSGSPIAMAKPIATVALMDSPSRMPSGRSRVAVPRFPHRPRP